jgi:hypothetical protein
MGKIGRTYPNTQYASSYSERSNPARPTRSALGPADFPGPFDPASRTVASSVIGFLVVLGLLGWLLTHWAS